jgi:hypothetical protein
MLFSAEPLADNNNIEQSLIAALDIVQGLLKGSRIRRLLLRFACMHLARTVVDYKTVAATDRIRGSTYRRVGRRDATVAIDMYLKAKQDVSGETLTRSMLLGYCRVGRRWADLAGSSPLLVFVLPQMAETIVYVKPFSLPHRDLSPQKAEQFHHRLRSQRYSTSDPVPLSRTYQSPGQCWPVCRIGSLQPGSDGFNKRCRAENYSRIESNFE